MEIKDKQHLYEVFLAMYLEQIQDYSNDREACNIEGDIQIIIKSRPDYSGRGVIGHTISIISEEKVEMYGVCLFLHKDGFFASFVNFPTVSYLVVNFQAFENGMFNGVDLIKTENLQHMLSLFFQELKNLMSKMRQLYNNKHYFYSEIARVEKEESRVDLKINKLLNCATTGVIESERDL